MYWQVSAKSGIGVMDCFTEIVKSLTQDSRKVSK